MLNPLRVLLLMLPFCLASFSSEAQQIKYAIDAEMVCNITTGDMKQRCSEWKRMTDTAFVFLDTKHKEFSFPGRDSLSFTYERRTVTDNGALQYLGKRDEQKGDRMFVVFSNDTGLLQICTRYNGDGKSNSFLVFHIKQVP